MRPVRFQNGTTTATAVRDRCALVVQHSSALDGSAHSGLLLADGLREAGWETHVVFGHAGPIIGRFERSGHAVHVVPHENWLRRDRLHQFVKDVWTEWRNASAIESLVADLVPDVVYVNTAVSRAGAVAARRAEVPCVWHLREMFADVGGEMRAPGWAIPGVRRVIRGHAARLVANSRATVRNLLGDEAAEVNVVPNGVREAFFREQRSRREARASLDLPLEVPLLGVPGTLRPMKGHPFLFRALPSLLRERSELRIAVTGGGEPTYTAGLKRQVRDLGLQDRISFVGWVDDMAAFYRACDLVCIPSRAEPFGRTAIEAFAVGTPVVASAVGGLKEIVRDGETGLLVSYDDVLSLRDALERLLDDPSLRKRMSENARQEGRRSYHEEVYKERVVRIVDDADRA